MAKDKIQNGQAEYGTVHVMEEEMRAAGQGVFEAHSSEAGMTKAERRAAQKAADASPETKMEAAPANKSAGGKVISAESMRTAPQRRKAAKAKR